MSKILRFIVYYPLVWIMIIPLIITDFFISLYNYIGLPLLKVEHVRRKNHIKIDRHKIKSLRWTQKIGCAYCGYANGLIPYTQEIAARTEKYWCPIKHDLSPEFIEPKHHKNFKKYSK